MTDPRRQDDEVLFAGALRGDEEALGRLLARDQDWAYNVAYRVLGQEADARDAVQDAFLHAVRAVRGEGSPPRSIESYRPWLRRVVANAALTQIRRRPSATFTSVDAVADPTWEDTHAEPGRAIEREETRAQVLRALLSLPETQRVALALRELLDASYDEIADALDLPRTAVGTLLFRARAGFRLAYDRVSETASPTDCPDLVPLFASIVDDQPRPAAWQELEVHLRECERCQGELMQQRRARRMYALLPLLALPAGWNPVAAALEGAAGTATSAGATSDAATGGSGAAADGGVTTAGSLGDAAAAEDLTAGVGAGQPAGSVGGAAPSAASGGAATSAGGAASTAAGSVVGTGAGGLIAGSAAAKLTIAALATAAVVGIGVVAGPLGAPGADATPAPSPAPVFAGSPAASPTLAALPSPGASPGSAVASSPGPPAPASTPAPGPGGPSPVPQVGDGSPGPGATAAGTAAAPFASPSVETPSSSTPEPASSPTPTRPAAP